MSRTKRELKWIDGVPDYLHAAGIRKGKWQFITEPELRSQTRPGPGHTLNSQLWAVGMLHSTNPEQLAIIWYRDNPKNLKEPFKSRSMTPGDMSRFLINEAIAYYSPAGLSPEEQKELRAHLLDKYAKERIRRGLAQLEMDGICERRRKRDGKPLRSLTPDQCRMLPSGQVETYFHLVPKDADLESVKAQWEELKQITSTDDVSSHDAKKVEVAILWLPQEKIPLILKGFQVDFSEIFPENGESQLTKKEATATLAAAITKPEYHETLRAVWENARESLVVKLREIMAEQVAITGLPEVAAAGPPEVAPTRRQDVSTGVSRGASSPVPEDFSSSSIKGKKKKADLPHGDDDEKPKAPEYASARDEVKAIHYAKTDTYPTVQLLDRIEGILVSKGQTWEIYLEVLKPHLGGNWKIPGAFLTHIAKTGFEPLASPPEEKPKPKCPRCKSDNQRGAILLDGNIVPCPDCSTSAEWRDELAAKMHRRAKSKAANP